ncbi:MAG: hypothetical protein IJ069_13300 [Prevotella sp.]|nr:hypothetical protein [Prevotella sp.]MBQ8154627.1 hypothetical protein [Prevotella sp.]
MRTIRLFSILALLFAQSQVICAEDKDLADAEDNTSWITSNNGGTFNVTLSGRTLYKDGDWNTLCLPFNLTKEQIAASPLADATIKELLPSSNLVDGKLTLLFQTATTIEAGKPYIVKWDVITINSDTDWKSFSNKVNEGTSYKGKIVRLGADITVKTANIVGTASAFEGTFDGCGHTITCEIDYLSNQYAAPFCRINNATIMNVKVTGSVKGGNHCAGLVGHASGTNTISNCEVAADVTCSGAYCGGVLGHGAISTTEIRDCLFSGTISGATTETGIIYGRSDAGTGTHTIVNCLANGTYSGGTVALMQGKGTNTATNSYEIQKITERGEALVTKLGSTNWTVSGEYAVPTLKAVSHVANPLFNAVTISDNINNVAFTGGTFKGNYAPLTISDSNRGKILLLAGSNKLGYAKTGTTPTLRAFRAYFEIPDGTPVRSFQLDYGDEERQTTGILQVEHSKESVENYYDLQGRKVTNPTKGLYIIGGRKVIIK